MNKWCNRLPKIGTLHSGKVFKYVWKKWLHSNILTHPHLHPLPPTPLNGKRVLMGVLMSVCFPGLKNHTLWSNTYLRDQLFTSELVKTSESLVNLRYLKRLVLRNVWQLCWKFLTTLAFGVVQHTSPKLLGKERNRKTTTYTWQRITTQSIWQAFLNVPQLAILLPRDNDLLLL